MFTMFTMFVIVMFGSIIVAWAYSAARQASARARCYRRQELRSLVRGAKRNAITRHFGRA